MMKIFALKEEELKEKTQDANFILPNNNTESAIIKRIPDSDSGFKNWADFVFWIPDSDCQP